MQTSTFNLDTAIAEAVTAHQSALTAHHATNAARERERQEQQAAMEAHEIATFIEHLRRDLSADLYAALEITVTWATYQPQATATIDGEAWIIGYGDDPFDWSITPPIGASGGCIHEALRSVLLRCIARRRSEHAQQEAERAAQLAEHTRCTVQLEATLEAARRDLWQWPDGHTLPLYHWRWSVGGTEFESAWSAADDLDPAGYVLLYQDHQLRTIRLDMLAHQPVIERRIVHTIDELPADLRERVRIEVPGIWFDYGLDQYRQVDDAVMCHEVGMIPCAWVCTLFAAESPR